MTADGAFRDELVIASRILADQGVVDGFGHVSARESVDGARFLISRSMAPALVTADDIMLIDLDGAPVADNRPAFIERFIHAAIYRARPDVMSVVHSHSPAVIPFGIVPTANLRPVYHMCAFIGDHMPVFDIRRAAGDGSDMLIRSGALGAALAEELGDQPAVLMRGHGSTVVGGSLRQAVFRAIYLEVGAKIQLSATALGAITFLSPGEAEAAAAVSDSQIDRAWALWARAVSTGS